MAFDRVERRDPGEIDRGGGKRRISRLDQHAVAGKREPADRNNRADHGGEDERREIGREHPGCRHQRRADERRRYPLRTRRPIGPSQRLAAQELLDDLRMGLDARHHRRQRSGDDVGERRCARADEHDRAAQTAEVRSRFENLPCRDRAARVRTREIDPDVSGGIGVNRQVAVANGQHAIHFPERGFAARVRGLDDIGRCALRDAQSLHGETGMEGAVHVENERHAPHDPVGVRAPVEEADARRVLGELGQRRERARRGRQELRRVVAGGDESRLD